MRAVYVVGACWLVATLGCQQRHPRGEPSKVGADLPVSSSQSVALPGSTDAADAPQAPSVAESERGDFTLYRDPDTGVSFRYPTIWRPPQAGELPAPAFAALAGPARVTQAFSPAGRGYASTVLKGMTFSYTAMAHSSMAACAALPRKATQSSPSQKVQYGGLPFTESHGVDAGMCTEVQSTVDTTLQGDRCLVFERDFITSCPFIKTPSLPRPLSAGERGDLSQTLDSAMQSVRIRP